MPRPFRRGAGKGSVPASFPPRIELADVAKQFDGTRQVTALTDINLDVGRGELVSIVGPSGSGKSTLLNLIGGLDHPSRGRIVIDGQPLESLSDDARTRLRRDKIGFIFQFFNLLPSLSCLENVALPLHLRGWPRRNAVVRAHELLALVQLSGRVDHTPDELSGGERQRTAIARALSIYPPILGSLLQHALEDILVEATLAGGHLQLGGCVWPCR